MDRQAFARPYAGQSSRPSPIVAISRLQMPLHVHAPVENADNDKAGFGEAVEDEMGADRVLEIPRSDIDRTSDLPACGQIVERIDDIAVIEIGLFRRPSLGRIAPNVFEIGSGAWRE